jgi:uncharacterized protein
MEKIRLILDSPVYRDCLRKIEEREQSRPFCKHGFSHFTDVARLAWIFVLEEKEGYSRSLVYAAALLHDLARWQEYDGEGCHALLSAQLAEPLLLGAGYLLWERELIINAIKEHRRGEDDVYSSPLSRLISKADKYSRLCFQCHSRNDCYKCSKMPHDRQLFY